MNQFLQKQVPVRLENREYEGLHERVLRRDGWRCQFCGTMTTLEVHHQQFRSQLGADSEDNLITLCTDCHFSLHCHWGVRSDHQSRARPLRRGGRI